MRGLPSILDPQATLLSKLWKGSVESSVAPLVPSMPSSQCSTRQIPILALFAHTPQSCHDVKTMPLFGSVTLTYRSSGETLSSASSWVVAHLKYLLLDRYTSSRPHFRETRSQLHLPFEQTYPNARNDSSRESPPLKILGY